MAESEVEVMMERDLLLAEKKEELQKQLEAWARENNLLGVGEAVIFSLKIVPQPMVICISEVDDYLRMSLREFFTRKRLTEYGMSSYQASLVCNAIERLNSWQKGKERGVVYSSMALFLEKYNSVRILKTIKGLGQPTVLNLVNVLMRMGFQIDPLG